MQRIIRVVFTAVLSAAASIYLGLSVMASSEVGFSVVPVLPGNQVPGVGGYFDLNVQPGLSQDLTIAVLNTGSEDITVTVEAITASTNSNGVINYTTPGELDETIPFSFSELVEIEQPQVMVPANNSKNITVSLSMPTEAYEGYLLGGIHITKNLTEEELQSDGMFLNQYGYVVGVRLTESDAQVEPEFALARVEAEVVEAQLIVVNYLRNTRPRMVTRVTVTAEIYPKGSSELLTQRTMEDVEMAPNSVFPFTLTDYVNIEPGDYISKIKLEYDGQVWNFEQEFTVAADEMAQDQLLSGAEPHQQDEAAGNEDVNSQPQKQEQTEISSGTQPPQGMMAGIVAAVLVLVCVVFVLAKRKKSS